jgi:exopolyphosphatase/guanosine-5'-triphosphate,3'-diphosphate pyrophosphatase
VLLAVAETNEGRWRPVLEKTWVTSLGEGTKETGRLSVAAIERTLHALSEAWLFATQAGSSSVVAGATMAARQAENRDDFLSAARQQGTPVFVLTGEQEAELGFHSVADDPAFEEANRLTIIDVGGQSTELVTANRETQDWTILFRRSFPVGTLGLRGSLLKSESPDARELLSAICEIDEVIGLNYLPGRTGKTIALGATGTNLVTIREKMSEWDPDRVHGAWLDYEEVSKAAGWLSGLTDAERSQVPGMEPGRERTIHIGALILERFLFATRSLGCFVSVRGWRHAVLERGLSAETTQ